MSEMTKGRCLVLASGSPRRRELLGPLVESFEIVVSGALEPVDASLTPAENVLAIAWSKADAVAIRGGECVILAADTDVVLDGQILGKPRDEQDAIAMLRALRGREHEVLTGVAVLDPLDGGRWDAVVRSLVRIRQLSDDEITRYVSTGEPMDKAGGYAIQGEAASMVESVDGCYTNVVGLPLCATAELLVVAGVSVDPAAKCVDPSGRRCPR